MTASLDSLILKAENLAKSGDAEGAISLAHELCGEYPNEIKVWSLCAYLYGRNGGHLEAINALTHAIGINDSEPKLFYDRGIEQLALRNNQAAVDDFTTALELCDKHADDYYRESLHFLRAEAFLGLNRKQHALADLKHVREDLSSWTFKLRTKAELVAECNGLPG